MSKRTITIALACASMAATALTATPSAVAGSSDGFRAVTGFDGARGFDIGASGKTVLAASDGSVYRVFRFGDEAGSSHKITQVPANYIAPAVAVADDNAVWILTGGGDEGAPGVGSLYLKKPGDPKRLVADIQTWVGEHNEDPFNLADPPGESNPYGVASLPDGSALVADAANNSLLHVGRGGRVEHIARVRPRVVEMPPGYESDPELPPPGTPMPAEAVITSVAVGPDGSYYIGELRGFPATPGTSEIWRIRPGATDAICRPKRPDVGACRRVADGLTSIVALESGPGGSIYAAELSKQSWFALDSGKEGSEIGAVIRISHDRRFRSELSPGEVVLPGAVAVGRSGGVFVSGPIFGPGGYQRVG